MVKFAAKYLNSLFLILISLILVSCGGDQVNKNDQIIAHIKAMETAVEDKHVDNFMTHVADNIQTERGWGKKDIERMLRLRLMRRTSVHIHPQLKNIEWLNNGNQSAQVEVVVAMAATAFNVADLAKINADLMKFQVTFERHNDDYRITHARWQPARPLDFL
ncbi:hypothetical protein [Marinicella gelatinilytica]|uniref:hypothetical protein n=1 Tax=Marinicella gelatinilytica TaxID=2996017 RepID=UPI002260EED0|nr:hypothetical protein [Marinicella gelatinilytica]MCX7544932.1 hypothetical protein [Marinicella gelatinilytica]